MKKFAIFASALVISTALVAPANAATVSKIPVSATSGSFKYVVNSLDCSKDTIGGKYIKSTADGTYCVFKVTVKNTSKSSEYIPASEIKAVDGKGNEYDHESGMAVYLKGTFMLDKVSPGNQKQGFLIYDVPKGTKLIKLVIPGGFLDDDVIVKL